MSIGKANSHLRDLTNHFEKSSRLRSLICEYYIIIVQFCTVMVKHTEKSPLGRFVHSLNESVLTDFQADMKEQERAVQQEVTLLTAREIRENGQISATLRSLVSGQTQRAQKQQAAAMKRAVLDFCSSYDYEQAWRTIRKAGIATVQRGDFLRWREDQRSATLLVVGKLGYGKSVLLANIIDDLHLNTTPNACTIAYFFCKHDDTQSLCPKTILGCILRQLLQPLPDLDRLEPMLHRNHSISTLEEVIKELPNLMSSDSRIFLVVDGLDECSHEDRREVLSALRSLQDRLKVSVCSSVRLTFDVSPQADYEGYPNMMKLHMSDDNPDLQAFIKLELIARLEARKIMLRDPLLIIQIQKKLLTESQGMFLWVVLQIYYLCGMKTDDEIREALVALPRTLSETFANILRRSAGDLGLQQQDFLKVMLATFEPLTTEQLREVMSVCPGDSLWHPSRVLNSMKPILATCGPLMVVNEENDTIHFVHHSFRQFLEEGANGAFQPEFDPHTADSVMASRVVTYMTYDIFGQKVSTTVAPNVAGARISAGVVKSLQPGLATRIAIRLLQSKNRPDAEFEIGHVLWQHRSQQGSVLETHPFYDYCKLHWRQHLLRISGSDAAIYAVLGTFLNGKANDLVLGSQDKEALLLEAMIGSNIYAAVAIIDAWEIEFDGNRMRSNLTLTRLVHTCLVSDGIEPAADILSDEILWVFGTRAASCGLTDIALFCLRQAFQRRHRSWEWIIGALTQPLESMLGSQHVEEYNSLFLSALCRDKYLDMAQLITLLDRCVFEKPLRGSAFGKPRDYLQEATLSAAMLDTAIYSGQEDLLARTLKERDRLDSKVYMDLAGHAFENKYFDIFLIMYGCAADWTSVTRLITQGRLLMGPELQASARISMSHKITFGSQLARGEKGLTAALLEMLDLGLFRDTQQIEGLHDFLNELLESEAAKHSMTQEFLEETNSVKAILLLVLIRQELIIAAFRLYSRPDDFLSIQKVLDYLPELKGYNSDNFVPLIDVACAKALDWGYEQAILCAEPTQHIPALRYWIGTVPDILASALHHRCMLTARSCLRTIVASRHGVDMALNCTSECKEVHGRGTTHLLQQLTDLTDTRLDKRELWGIAPCASYILEQYSPEWLMQLDLFPVSPHQQAIAARDVVDVPLLAREAYIAKLHDEISKAYDKSGKTKDCSRWLIPSEIPDALQEAVNELGKAVQPGVP